MIDPFTLFQPLPTPPPGVATWIEVQAMAADSAQAYWAENQAFWARFGAWTQLATVVAASLAGFFAWDAARQARRQAHASETQLGLALQQQRGDGLVAAVLLRRRFDETFGSALLTTITSVDAATTASILMLSFDRTLPRAHNCGTVFMSEVIEYAVRTASSELIVQLRLVCRGFDSLAACYSAADPKRRLPLPDGEGVGVLGPLVTEHWHALEVSAEGRRLRESAIEQRLHLARFSARLDSLVDAGASDLAGAIRAAVKITGDLSVSPALVAPA